MRTEGIAFKKSRLPASVTLNDLEGDWAVWKLCKSHTSENMAHRRIRTNQKAYTQPLDLLSWQAITYQ